MDIKSIGTNADKMARVDISKVYKGYFSDPKNIARFIELGIQPIFNHFPMEMTYVDFGGGQGHLAVGVKKYLENSGRKIRTVVVDANEDYLKDSEEKGLEIQLCNLEEVSFSNLDLVTMRAVLHYNAPKDQRLILKNILNSLKTNGHLVHQNSSGNKENCDLRSAISNIPELGRAGSGNYHWICEDDYFQILKEVGFKEITHVGYTKSNEWSPEEQWDRFNSDIVQKVLKNNNQNDLNKIEDRKSIYLQKAYGLIDEYSNKYGKEYLGIIDTGEGRVLIRYSYPIIISKK